MLLCVGLFAKLPSFEELEHPDSKLATQVIAEDGEVLTTFHIENRTYALTATEAASSSPKAPASSFWKRSRTPKLEAPASTANWAA